MYHFNLPSVSQVGRVVPKNAFDAFTNTKQKQLLVDAVQRITWTHKLSRETVNLESKDVVEIQVFKIELKEKVDISKILEIINKAIPYHIVFWVEHRKQAYISTSAKHPHVTNENVSVLDWVFSSEWFDVDSNPFKLRLRGNLDLVFKDFCAQLAGKPELAKESFEMVLNHQKEVDRLKKEVVRLKSAISRSNQFNEKVTLNLQLRKAERSLKSMC